jgi:hypothetical protein
LSGQPYTDGFASETLRRFLDGESLHIEISAAEFEGIRRLELAESKRERLLCQLMFASKDLAGSQIEPADGDEPAFCTECVEDERGGHIAHLTTCRTGRVLGIIRDLADTLPEFNPNRKEAAPDGETGRAGDGIRPRGIRLTEAAAALRQAALEEMVELAGRLTRQCNICGSSTTGQDKTERDIVHGCDCWVGNALVVLSSDDVDPEQSEPREWIIQRCTQKWIGSELQYEDYPTPEGVMTHSQALEVLERVDRADFTNEFRAHCVRREGGAQ